MKMKGFIVDEKKPLSFKCTKKIVELDELVSIFHRLKFSIILYQAQYKNLQSLEYRELFYKL